MGLVITRLRIAMIWLMVEYGSKTGRRAMQLELLTKFFGHWVRSWLVKQGRHVVRGLMATARHTLLADTGCGEVEDEVDATNCRVNRGRTAGSLAGSSSREERRYWRAQED
jgi:hypothetical protein